MDYILSCTLPLVTLTSVIYFSKNCIYNKSVDLIKNYFYTNTISIKNIGKNKYEIEFVIDGKKYREIKHIKRRKQHISKIKSKCGKDLTEDILPHIEMSENTRPLTLEELGFVNIEKFNIFDELIE